MTATRDTPLPTGFAATDGAVLEPDTQARARFGRTEGDGAAAFAEERRLLREAYTTKELPRGGIGWKLGLAVDLVLLSLPVPAVIMIPPLMECRHTAIHVGFFAGDSFETCARRRIAARWTHLDSRLKMIVRNSGQ